METRVSLAADSNYIGWDILCLGRAASGERFEHGKFDLFYRVDRNNCPIWIERGGFDGNDPMLSSPAGWAGASVCGTCCAAFPSYRNRQQACSKPAAQSPRPMPPAMR
jgi:urease accessory protein